MLRVPNSKSPSALPDQTGLYVSALQVVRLLPPTLKEVNWKATIGQRELCLRMMELRRRELHDTLNIVD